MAVAELEAAVAATSTALAIISQNHIVRVNAVSDISHWLRLNEDIVLLGSLVLGASLLVAGLFFEIWRRKASLDNL
jgi:hypothetical protein